VAFVLIAELKVRRGCVEAYLALLEETVEGLSSSPCFVDFSVHVSSEEPERVLLYETWASPEEYRALRSGDIFQAYLARRGDLVESVQRSEWRLIGRKESDDRGVALTAF
jgi:quinol monooxygenase YgiN